MIPASNRRFIARCVISVSSVGWLKCVCSTTSLCSLRPRSTTPASAENHASSVKIFCGITAGPLVAKRMRRTFGMSSKRFPIAVMCSARRLYESPPLMTMSSSSGRDAMYPNARSQRSIVGFRLTFSNWSVSMPTA